MSFLKLPYRLRLSRPIFYIVYHSFKKNYYFSFLLYTESAPVCLSITEKTQIKKKT